MIRPYQIRSVRVAAVVTLGLSCATAISTFAEEVFRRAESLEEIVGHVELRRAYGASLQVVVDCDERPSGCREERTYGDLFQLDFWLRTQESRGDSVVSYEDPAGTIFIATDFDDADRASFLTELEDTLVAIRADAFDLPLAGLGPSRFPFDKATLAPRSVQPTWLCLRTHGQMKVIRFHRREDAARVLGVGAKYYEMPPTDVCAGIASATDSASPESFWTLSSPRRQREWVVEFFDRVALDEDPRSLATRPDGVQLLKQPMPNDGALDSTSVGEEQLSRATHASNGWRFDAWAPPAAMPIAALDENAWLQAWTVRAVERRFGARPGSRIVARTTTYAAFLPTVPAARLAETFPDGSYRVSATGRLESAVVPSPPRTMPRIERAAFVEQLIEDLVGDSGDPHDPIDRLLRRPIAGLGSEGWIVVVCNADGQATYSLPPTRASNRVTNADLFCAALESRLDRRPPPAPEIKIP